MDAIANEIGKIVNDAFRKCACFPVVHMPTPVFFFENVGLPFSGLDCVEY
jgi:hypothetical protein